MAAGATNDYDGSIALDVDTHGKLAEGEIKTLKEEKLKPLFIDAGEDATEEDVNDILDYTFAMVNNGKTMEYVVQELVGMEMDFCPEETAHKVAKLVAEYIQENKSSGDAADGDQEEEKGTGGGSNKRVVSLKSKTEGNALTMSGALGSNKKPKGNALTMSGALGSSRVKEDKQQKGAGRQNRDDNRRGGRADAAGRAGRNTRGGRGGGRDHNNRRDGRSGRGDRKGRAAAAFDRLANKDREEGGHPRRLSRGYDDDPRRGTPGRGRGGRGQRDGRIGRGVFSGSRRSRDEMEQEEEFMPAPGGRGPGRRGGRMIGRGPSKRMKPSEIGGEGEDPNAYYDESQGYTGYDESYGYYPPGGFRGGRGRGRGRFSARGRGRFGPRNGGEVVAEGTDGQGGELSADAAEFHPSPIVASNYSGRLGYSGGFRGRGRAFRGRGFIRGGPGRSEVVKSMIASKTWVRSKDGEGSNNQDSSGGGDGQGAAES